MPLHGLRRWLSLLAPEGLFVLAVVVWYASDWFAAPKSWLSPGVVLAAYAVVALVALRLRRTRVVLALVALSLALFVLPTRPANMSDPVVTLAVAAAMLLPLNLLILGLIPDRAVLGRTGLVHFMTLFSQAALLLLAVAAAPDHLDRWMNVDILPPMSLVPAPIPDGILVASGISMAVLALVGLLWPDPIRRGMLWTTVALLVAVHEAYAGGTPMVFLFAAGVVLIISVVESSFALAYRDGLTGLPSRRAFNEELRRLGSRYTIAMVDVDRFKGINDRYGHDVGDQVLRMVAKRLSRVTGRGRAFRYGGEEFAVVFTGRRLDEVVPHLERLRQAIEAEAFTIRGPDRPKRKPRRRAKKPSGDRPKLTITVSIGAAERTERLTDAEEVIKEADRRLYRAKNEGRNRVVA